MFIYAVRQFLQIIAAFQEGNNPAVAMPLRKPCNNFGQLIKSLFTNQHATDRVGSMCIKSCGNKH